MQKQNNQTVLLPMPMPSFSFGDAFGQEDAFIDEMTERFKAAQLQKLSQEVTFNKSSQKQETRMLQNAILVPKPVIGKNDPFKSLEFHSDDKDDESPKLLENSSNKSSEYVEPRKREVKSTRKNSMFNHFNHQTKETEISLKRSVFRQFRAFLKLNFQQAWCELDELSPMFNLKRSLRDNLLALVPDAYEHIDLLVTAAYFAKSFNRPQEKHRS